MNNFDYQFRYIIVGDSCKDIQFKPDFIIKLFCNFFNLLVVGKSCILNRFTNDSFKNEHEATIGVEFGGNNLTI